MERLTEARTIAIGMGGTITNNDVGFIVCFAASQTAEQFVMLIEEYEEITAEQQQRCVIVVTVNSLM
ncbi:MAG: hypothetical protein AAF716_21820 [Cyanobacteria bacterium P01_D01_bin.1]